MKTILDSIGQLLFESHYNPAPPSTNHLYRRGSHGRIFRTKQYDQWRRDAVMIFRANGDCPDQPYEDEVTVFIKINIAGHHDIANREKGIMDAVQDAGIIRNDSQVAMLIIKRAAPDDPLAPNEYSIMINRYEKY